jgi:O-antigen/teichoic acid export membrane protein
MSVRRSVFWAFSGQIVSAVVGFGGSVLIARLLSPYEFGLNAIAIATSGILSVLAASGADALIVREVNLTRQIVATATTVNAILFIILSAVLFCISFFAETLLGDYKAGSVIRILAILPLLNILAFRPSAMLQRNMRFKAAALVISTSVIVNNAVTIGGIILGGSYLSPAIGAVSGVLITLLLYIFISPGEIIPRFSVIGIKSMAIFGLRMVSVSGAGQFVQHVSQIILGRMLGISILGLYSRATLLANFLFSQLYGTATRVTFAQMSKTYRETGEIKEIFLRSFYIIVSVMWPLLLSLAILSKPVLVLLYGDRWVGAAVPFAILLVAQAFTLSFGMNWELFVIRDRLAVQTRYEIARSILGLAAFVIGCMFSMTMAAMGRLVDAIIGCVLYFPWMGRLSGANNQLILKVYGRSGAIAAVTILPPFGLMMATGWDAHPPLPWLASSVLGSVLCWGVMLRILAHPLLAEARLVYSVGRRTLARIPYIGLHRLGRADAANAPQPIERAPIDERF